ncbi:MAG: hypothetical protein QXU40_00930 [Candidatus Pacearchaeota archaeon]
MVFANTFRRFFNSPPYIFVFVLIIFILVLSLIYLTEFSRIEQIRIIDAEVQVSNFLGFNIDTEELIFGVMMPGNTGKRVVILNSSKPVFVKIKSKGDIAKWISFSDNNFILDGYKEINFYISIPDDAKYGNYTGKVIVYFLKPD